MAGHRPFSELTKDWTPERWQRVREAAEAMAQRDAAAEAADQGEGNQDAPSANIHLNPTQQGRAP